MSTVTLADIEATQTQLANMIAAFKSTRSTRVAIAETEIELRPGEHYAGPILNDDGSVSHHLVLLPGQRDAVNWSDACAWAVEIGGDLPSRREQSLLFANLKGKFEAAWYWSNETHESNGSYAWVQYFDDGVQLSNGKSYEGHARAVRRLTA